MLVYVVGTMFIPTLSQTQASGANVSALSPVKIENTISIEALKFEYSLVQTAVKSGHKDAPTLQRGRQVGVGCDATHLQRVSVTSLSVYMYTDSLTGWYPTCMLFV